MSSWLPSLNALRAFEAVARHLHYPRAADELNVSPAAVKQLVAKLEASIGAPLIVRDGRGLALTSEGQRGQNDLTSAMELLMSAVQKMGEPASGKRLIVTAESSLATTWLVPKLADFRNRYPHINVLIDSSQEVVDLQRSDVDIAIRYGVRSESPLVVRRLFSDRIFPACSPSLANGPFPLKQLSDLNHVPLIHWDFSKIGWAQSTERWFSWQKWLAYMGVSDVVSDRGTYFSDYGLAVQAAIAGQGVVLASWPILQDLITAGLLVCPFKEVVSTDIGYDIVTTGRASQRPEVEEFVSWILEVAIQEE